jgi:hypothetical protein
MVALATALVLGLTKAPVRRVAAVASSVLLAGVFPAGAVMAMGGAAVAEVAVRVRRRRRRAEQCLADLASVCEVLAIALTGGLGIHGALQLASNHVGGPLASEIQTLLRRAQIDGLSEVLASSEGSGSRLYRIISRAAVSGSSLLDPVKGLARDLESEIAARRLEAMRRTPVTLLIPLTVLVLPGFLLLSIAPAVLEAFGRLDL